MLLIYGAQEIEDARSPEEAEALMNEYGTFSAMLQSRKAMLSGEALHPTTMATTVRVRDGKALTTDGPFAETKEQLGGYYVVEAKDLDEAIEFASQIPNARDGSVEIRPVMVFE
jgi:hypothetical protein